MQPKKWLYFSKTFFTTNWQRGDIAPVNIEFKLENLKTYANFQKIDDDQI